MSKSILTEGDSKIVAYYNSLSKQGKKNYLKFFDIIVLEFTDDGFMTVEYNDSVGKVLNDIAKERDVNIEEAFNEMLRSGINFFKEKGNETRRKKSRSAKKAKN